MAISRFGTAFAHALVADLPVGQQATRSWYGKMFLPPLNAIIVNGDKKSITYRKYRDLENKIATGSASYADKENFSRMLPSACEISGFPMSSKVCDS